MRIVDFISETHLGDCIMHTDFLNKMIKIDDNIKVNFYIFEKFKDQVEEFIEDHTRIIPLSHSDAPKNVNRAWMAQYGQITSIPFDFGQLKLNFYKKLCAELNLKCPYNTIIDLLPDSNLIHENVNDENWDILLINSDGHSGQTNGTPLDCSNFIKKFKNKKIITTKKIENIPCTLDLNYSVLDIGKLSLKCNVVIGVHTAPWHTSMNKKNYDMNKKFYHIDANNFYSYSNCKTIKNLDIFI
jgi:hypothetical protein